jgi:hypothetical protein
MATHPYRVCSASGLTHDNHFYAEGTVVQLTTSQRTEYAAQNTILELVIPTNPVPSILFDENLEPTI